MEDNSLYSYAFIKTLYNQERDVLDAVAAFALQVVPEEIFLEPLEIARTLEQRFHIIIPLHVLSSILHRAKRNGYILQAAGTRKYRLSPEGCVYVNRLEEQEDVERRIQALFIDIVAFFERRGATSTASEVQGLLTEFIAENIGQLVDFVDPSSPAMNVPGRMERRYSALLIRYLQTAKKEKPEAYTVVQEMVYGSIISALLQSRDANALGESVDRKFRGTEAYLDSNIVFSIMGFHTEELNEAARELLTIMQRAGFVIRVFEFTVDEIANKIKGYLIERDRYPTNIRVDSIYGSMKRRGWKGAEVNEFLTNLEQEIKKYNIEIVYGTGVNLRNYHSGVEELRGALVAYGERHPVSLNHDLAAIDRIRELRRTTIRRIEDAKVIFVSSDVGLYQFDRIELGHRDALTISEVILDRILANMLWVKDPSIDLPLSSIIAAHSRDLMVNKAVWLKFHSILKALKDEGIVSDIQVATLLYNSDIEDRLLDFENEHEVSRDMVISEAQKAFEEATATQAAEAEEKRALEVKLARAIEDREQYATAHADTIMTIKSALKKTAEADAQKRARRWFYLVSGASIALEVAAGAGIVMLVHHWRAESSAGFILAVLVASLGDAGLIPWTLRKFRLLRQQRKAKLVDAIYVEKLRGAGMNEDK